MGQRPLSPPSPFRAGPRELQGVGATQEAAPFAVHTGQRRGEHQVRECISRGSHHLTCETGLMKSTEMACECGTRFVPSVRRGGGGYRCKQKKDKVAAQKRECCRRGNTPHPGGRHEGREILHGERRGAPHNSRNHPQKWCAPKTWEPPKKGRGQKGNV